MSRIGYTLLYGICRLIGALPYGVLYYAIAPFIRFILYRVFHYRIDVVRENLQRCFPEKSRNELREIEKRYYSHLSEVIVDAIDLVGITHKELSRRMRIVDARQQNIRTEGRDWIAALAHYGSWEYFNAYQFYTPSQVVAIYKPLHNKAVDRLYYNARHRTGAEPVAKRDLLRYIISNQGGKRNLALGLIADQTPPKSENTCLDFLGVPTLFYMGIEKIAVKFGMPVYFMRVRKTGRAMYEATFESIYDGKEKLPEGEITRRYAHSLEDMIREEPSLWMWSHKRWKHISAYAPHASDQSPVS